MVNKTLLIGAVLAASIDMTRPRCKHGVDTTLHGCWGCIEEAKPMPTRLDLDVDPPGKCKQYRVFFNDVEQFACTVADVTEGYILRYKHAIGRQPVRGRAGKIETVKLMGKVEIRRRDRHEP